MTVGFWFGYGLVDVPRQLGATWQGLTGRGEQTAQPSSLGTLRLGFYPTVIAHPMSRKRIRFRLMRYQERAPAAEACGGGNVMAARAV